MAQRFRLGNRTSNVTIANAAIELRAGAILRINLHEVRVHLASAAASVIGLGRPAAIGITPTTPKNLLTENTNESQASAAQTALAWVTGPTAPAEFLGRASLTANIGEFTMWKFDDGLEIPAGGSIVLWNITGNALMDVDFVISESSYASTD